MKNNNSIAVWLFTPFRFIAGTKALIIGLVVMLLLSILGYLSNTHFDGALDIHYGCLTIDTLYLPHILYQLVGWGLLTLVFYLTARIVTKSSIRLIDIAGTMALSQAPLIFAALLGFIPSFHICIGDINTINMGEMMAVLKENAVMMTVAGLVTMLFAIWSIVLKYNAYSVSANIKGVVGGISFAIALIVAEILSKIVLYIIL